MYKVRVNFLSTLALLLASNAVLVLFIVSLQMSTVVYHTVPFIGGFGFYGYYLILLILGAVLAISGLGLAIGALRVADYAAKNRLFAGVWLSVTGLFDIVLSFVLNQFIPHDFAAVASGYGYPLQSFELALTVAATVSVFYLLFHTLHLMRHKPQT